MMQILERRIEFATPWFEVVAKRTSGGAAPFYALRMLDYVSVAALTAEEELVLVRQYRPAVERYTLELPSGHVERGETPEQSARRELAEECGLRAPELELLGAPVSDTGRHENRLWCYVARGVRPVKGSYVPEPGIERILVPRGRLPEVMAGGEFDHALNLAVLMLVLVRHQPEALEGVLWGPTGGCGRGLSRPCRGAR